MFKSWLLDYDTGVAVCYAELWLQTLFASVFDPDENVIYVTQIYFFFSTFNLVIQHPVHVSQGLGDTCSIVDGVVFRQLAPWLDQIKQGATQIGIR